MKDTKGFVEDLYLGSEAINEMRRRITRVTQLLAGCVSTADFSAWKRANGAGSNQASSESLNLPGCPWVVYEISASRQEQQYVFFRCFSSTEGEQTKEIFVSNREPQVHRVLEVYRALPALVELFQKLFPTSLYALQIYVDASHVFGGKS